MEDAQIMEIIVRKVSAAMTGGAHVSPKMSIGPVAMQLVDKQISGIKRRTCGLQLTKIIGVVKLLVAQRMVRIATIPDVAGTPAASVTRNTNIGQVATVLARPR